MGLPDLRMADPTGSLLLEKMDHATNNDVVSIGSDGTHGITVEHTALTKGATWSVEITWYPDIACT